MANQNTWSATVAASGKYTSAKLYVMVDELNTFHSHQTVGVS